MSVPQSVSDVLRSHVTLELEGIDRMYLNVIVPPLQYPGGVSCFFRSHRKHLFASSALMAPITESFVASIHCFASSHRIELVDFKKGERKDDVCLLYTSPSPRD